MSGIQRFADRIEQIDGVSNYIVVRNDGQMIIHNLDEPEKLTSLLTFGGFNTQAIQKTLGFSQFGYLVYIRPRNQNLIIFSLDKYFLGIVQKMDSNQSRLIEEVGRFLFKLKNQKRSNNLPKGEEN